MGWMHDDVQFRANQHPFWIPRRWRLNENSKKKTEFAESCTERLRAIRQNAICLTVWEMRVAQRWQWTQLTQAGTEGDICDNHSSVPHQFAQPPEMTSLRMCNSMMFVRPASARRASFVAQWHYQSLRYSLSLPEINYTTSCNGISSHAYILLMLENTSNSSRDYHQSTTHWICDGPEMRRQAALRDPHRPCSQSDTFEIEIGIVIILGDNFICKPDTKLRRLARTKLISAMVSDMKAHCLHHRDILQRKVACFPMRHLALNRIQLLFSLLFCTSTLATAVENFLGVNWPTAACLMTQQRPVLPLHCNAGTTKLQRTSYLCPLRGAPCPHALRSLNIIMYYVRYEQSI